MQSYFKTSQGQETILSLALFLTVFVSRMPAFNSWWCLDDWGQLSQAANIHVPPSGFPARWLSQYLVWDLFYSVFKLNFTLHTVIRILIHSSSAVLVFKIGKKFHLSQFSSFFAGILFGVATVSFTTVYWASGIQELLATFFGVFSLERWLCNRSKRSILASFVLFLASVLAKESAMALPLILGALQIFVFPHRFSHSTFRWTILFAMVLIVVGESHLVLNHFATAKGANYELGGIETIIMNLGKFGWWIFSFSPIFPPNLTTFTTAMGICFFLVWGGWSLVSIFRNNPFPLITLIWVVFGLSPALPLIKQTHPYLAYFPIIAFCLLIGQLLPKSFPGQRKSIPIFIVVAVFWGIWSMQTRISNTNINDRPADPVVFSAKLSREAIQLLATTDAINYMNSGHDIVILQPPISIAQAEKASDLGDHYISNSALSSSLGGILGPQLYFGPETHFQWVNSLISIPVQSRVFCESGNGLLNWGSCWEGLLYATVVDISFGHFDRARMHLLRGYSLNKNFEHFIFDPETCPVSESDFKHNSLEFLHWFESLKDLGIASQEDVELFSALYSDFVTRVGWER